MPFASDLAADAVLARQQHLSLLILFSLPSCPYCREVIRDYLVPMQRDPAYRRKILIRQVEIDSAAALRDFSGKQTTQRQFARRYRVKLAPTIVLVDAQGRLLTNPLVGVTIPDYYGGFLDEAIDQAWRRVRRGGR